MQKSINSGFFYKNINIILLLRITEVSNCSPTHEELIQLDYFCSDDWYPVSEGTEVFNTCE